MNTIKALRALLALIDELDTQVFEAPVNEPLALKLRRHLEQMGDLVAQQLSELEREALEKDQ